MFTTNTSNNLILSYYHHQKLKKIIQKYTNNSEINLDKQNLSYQDLEFVVQEVIINKQSKRNFS